ncbi:conserved hypothetical protein [Shewanella halifaxensis HAW-EB4]|uniref:Lipoprotein n=1 Tax=Shewanella halifaxensis (strain HAW-EB4) TaxID=458817 RepID=B0TUM7_SHEHH|nr:hypothetical protein [Shewanella halifaxensis]ABZ76755.1 conserved hypothetical protein [Shewanella halifaxensis HAW-EB4]
MQVTHKSAVLGGVYICILGLFLLGCEPNNPESAGLKHVDTSLCNFKSGLCAQTVADVVIQLSITPWQAPSERPLQLNLNTSAEVGNVKVKLQGRDMFMGVIPVNLAKIGKNDYKAPLIYGSCSSGYMVWSAVVSFEVDGVERFTTFDFLADHPG